MYHDTDFVFPGLTASMTHCVAQMCGMTYATHDFRGVARDAMSRGAFADCVTLGDYAKALLHDRLTKIASYERDGR